MTTFSQSLMHDATNHLNSRQRGMAARLARLSAGGVPTDREGMAAWLSAELDKRLESAGGVYHCCTVRKANRCDAELPTLGGIGCRISRVPVKARYVAAGEVVEQDEEGEDVIADEPFFIVQWGVVGTGFTAPTFDHASETAEEAEDRARQSLLMSGKCFRTRGEARVAVEKMLRERVRA